MEEQESTTPVDNEQSSADEDADDGLLPLPDIGDLYFVLILNLTLFTRPTFLFGDGSTGWHLVTGEYILKTMSVPRQDLMSYTFPDKQWVAYEWLYDAFLALLEKAGGMNLLAVATSIIIGYIFLRLYDRCRSYACPLALSCVFTLVGVLASAMHWLVRPHVVTLLGVFLYSTLLEDFYQSRISKKKLILCLALFMVLWVNCHPAFLFGIAITGLYMVVTFLESLLRKDPISRLSAKTKAISLAIALAVIVLASLLNPYGFQLYEYIAHYLKGSAVLAETDEFLSPNFKNNIHALCLELLFLFLAIGLAVSKNRPSIPQFCLTLVFAHLTLSAQRNIPLFSIVVLPVLGKLFGANKSEPEPESEPKQEAALDQETAPEQAETTNVLTRYKKAWVLFEEQEARCKMHIIACAFALAMIGLALMGGSIGGKKILKSGWDSTNKPTTTVEYLKDHNLVDKPGCNFDNWGGYLRYRLGKRVFIDDRADFYGEPFYFKYREISNTYAKWKDILKEYKVEWVLFPNNSRVVMVLNNDPEWQMVCEDPASKLFVRKDSLTSPATSDATQSQSPPTVAPPSEKQRN